MDDYRFVVDDASLVIPAQLVGADLEAAFDRLSDQLQACRRDGDGVAIIGDYDVLDCRAGMKLHELLTSGEISRDCRVRAYGLLDKCTRFDADASFAIDPAIEVDGVRMESFALALIADRRRQKVAIGALALVPRSGPGLVTIRDETDEGPAFIIIDLQTRLAFYRSIFEVEDTPEAEFFVVARRAFPSLRFASTVSFRRFEGTYAELRESVVTHLAALNDRFRDALQSASGMPDGVSAATGIDMSIEGATRGSERLMRARDVDYKGHVYRCEWHSKLEPHRNRIHVHRGDEHTNDCVLIGIFVDHLAT